MVRNQPLDGARCRKSGYELAGLSENRCPECGGAFDPGALPAPKPLFEPSPQDRPAATAAVSTMVWAVLLAVLVPWRVFPTVRRMGLKPLLIVYFLSVAGHVAMTVHDYPWQSAPITLQRVLVGLITSIAWGFVTLYVILVLSIAARQQRVLETLGIGLRFTLIAKASAFPCFVAIYGIWHLFGGQFLTWVVLLQVGAELYWTGAMSLSAAWLADPRACGRRLVRPALAAMHAVRVQSAGSARRGGVAGR